MKRFNNWFGPSGVMKKLTLAVILLCTWQIAQASGNDLSDVFFRSGKYYVVVGVLTLVFLGVFIYLFKLDRKVGRLEKKINK